MDTDTILRTERVRIIRNELIALGISGQRLVAERDGQYERVVDDVTRAGGRRVQSMGACVIPG